MTTQYYFNEDRRPNELERCVICGERAIYNRFKEIVNLSYCGTCDEYFCSVDVGNWYERGMATAVKAKKHIMEKFA